MKLDRWQRQLDVSSDMTQTGPISLPMPDNLSLSVRMRHGGLSMISLLEWCGVQASRKLGITEVDLSRAEAGLEAAET